MDLMNEFGSEIDAMAFAIDKYNINEFQGELFKRKNKPNPIFISEMKNDTTFYLELGQISSKK